jgi:hypothetical protein
MHRMVAITVIMLRATTLLLTLFAGLGVGLVDTSSG